MVKGIDSKLYSSQFFFTMPWEPIIVRRGDALGLGPLADQFANAVAPQLSNRIRDGRWITIIAWCLERSHQLFHASGGRKVKKNSEQQKRYGWLRPLELMWVARTIFLVDDSRNRAIAGQRSVRRWCKLNENERGPRFGLTSEQFRGYRQTGMYGAYRTAFRLWPGLTIGGDGWTPGRKTIELAKWLDVKLDVARPSWNLQSDKSDVNYPIVRKDKSGKVDESDWWIRKWGKYSIDGKRADVHTLPRPNSELNVLPESHLLAPLIFGDDSFGKRRLAVAKIIETSNATNHLDLCKELGSGFPDDQGIALLPHFSRMTDAGMALMNLIAEVLDTHVSINLRDVVSHPDAKERCSELFNAAQEWSKNVRGTLRHLETANRFAEKFSSKQPILCLTALLEHHEMYGGGVKWFVLHNQKIEVRGRPSRAASNYRFRLESLCRLAMQCGVIRDLPPCLDIEAAWEDEEGNSDE